MKANIVYRKSSLLYLKKKTQVRFALFNLKRYLMEYQYVIEDLYIYGEINAWDTLYIYIISGDKCTIFRLGVRVVVFSATFSS